MTTPEEQTRMLMQLAGSTALLPQEIPEDAESPAEDEVALPVIEQDGTFYVPVFTSEQALVTAGADPQKAVAVPVVQLAANWPTGEYWMAVDPSTDHGLTVPPDLVRAMPGLVGAGGNGSL